MRNKYVELREASDIDRAVSRILKDLGNPNPPVRMEIVRDRLKLDLAYYSAKDVGMIREMIHKLTIASKQVIERPLLLGEAIVTFDLKALLLPDQKRIMLSSELPTAKKRWNEAHETAHSVIRLCLKKASCPNNRLSAQIIPW